MQVVLNPSPVADNLKALPLEKISWFILNEVEGAELSGETEPEKMLERLTALYPHAQIVLTLGGEGSVYAFRKERIRQSAFRVQAVDTTAAGDTFTGFFFAAIAAACPCRTRCCARARLRPSPSPGPAQRPASRG